MQSTAKAYDNRLATARDVSGAYLLRFDVDPCATVFVRHGVHPRPFVITPAAAGCNALFDGPSLRRNVCSSRLQELRETAPPGFDRPSTGFGFTVSPHREAGLL